MNLIECFKKYKCDKGLTGPKNPVGHYYHLCYEPDMEPLRNESIKILEVGIWRGTSMSAFHDYFPNAELYGIDTFGRHAPREVEALKRDRTHWLKCSSMDPNIKEQMKLAWDGVTEFDIIIDDGLHTPKANQQTFNNLWSCVKPGGIYYVEDIDPRKWPKDFLSEYNPEICDYRKESGHADSVIYRIRK